MLQKEIGTENTGQFLENKGQVDVRVAAFDMLQDHEVLQHIDQRVDLS